jgi:hypothetical protein
MGSFGTFVEEYVAGLGSAIVAKTALAPINRALIPMDIPESTKYKHYETLKQFIGREGVRAIWRGNLHNCRRYAPGKAFTFALKHFYARAAGLKQNEFTANLLAANCLSGGTAGVTCSAITYPMQTLRYMHVFAPFFSSNQRNCISRE